MNSERQLYLPSDQGLRYTIPMSISIPHREKCSDKVQGHIMFQWLLTGFFFLHRKFMPVGFHPIPQCHP